MRVQGGRGRERREGEKGEHREGERKGAGQERAVRENGEGRDGGQNECQGRDCKEGERERESKKGQGESAESGKRKEVECRDV